ncbi:TPR end-of-group domain-containing protein [Candidatus Uabimicrobium amorphum]|uniref:Tetratricopeptide repeat protein n=1 Tax=Uabimicrobium amorphum TaxID=2596890 RepID=A0A5S9IUZ4_UABAM|nr:hypothetical protein [Candidatus Uabimicrobium amorphum]BBM88076.1 hypothetical protein UABAM_06492 [Candidatus Uabimicrobium amorphum]
MTNKKYLTLALLIFLTIPIYSQNTQVEFKRKVDNLCRLLEHPFSHKRKLAAEQLISLGKNVSPYLAKIYSRCNYLMKREIIDIWQRIGDKRSIEYILQAINDSDEGVRMRVAGSLLELSDREPLLVNSLKEITPQTRKERNTLQEIIDTLSYKQVESELAKLISPYGGHSLCYEQYKPIVKMGGRVIKPLLAMYTEDNYRFIHLEFTENYPKGQKMKLLAGYALTQMQEFMGKRQRVMVLARLRKMRYHKDPGMRRSVACILKEFKFRSWWNQIIEHDKKLVEKDPTDDNICYHLGLMLLRVGRNYQAIRYLKQAVSVNPDDSLAYYHLACAHARRRSKQKAIKALKDAFARGFRDYKWASSDGDLRNLHSTTEYKKLIAQIKEAYLRDLLKYESRN